MSRNLIRPIFEYSLGHRMLGWAIAAPIVTGFYVWYISIEPLNLRLDLILLLIGLIPEIQLVRFWRMRIHGARFFDDHFEISRRSFVESISYPEIERVVVRKSSLGPTSVLIRLQGRREALIMSSNPMNRELNSDLGHWLLSRTPNNQSEAPS